MEREISVQDALNKGLLYVNLPVIAIITGSLLLLVVLIPSQHIDGWMLVLLLPGSIVMAWIYWSLAITHWRIWAFSRVRNVHELERRAIKAKLMWPGGHLGEKTEIRTEGQKGKLHQIAKRFEQDDVFDSDQSIASETKVFVSKPAKIFLLVLFGAILIFCGVNWHLHPMLASAFILLSLRILYDSIKNLLYRSPQLILSESGITLKNGEFYPWKIVWNEDIVLGNNSSATLQFYDQRDTFVSQRVDELSLSPGKIEKLLIEYRGRYESGDKTGIVVTVALAGRDQRRRFLKYFQNEKPNSKKPACGASIIQCIRFIRKNFRNRKASHGRYKQDRMRKFLLTAIWTILLCS